MRDDHECEDADEAVTPVPGSVAGSGGSEELASVLLEMIGLATKVAVMLGETDEDDWRGMAGRLDTFLSLVSQFPEKPRPRRRVGFKPPIKSKATPKNKRRTRRKS